MCTARGRTRANADIPRPADDDLGARSDAHKEGEGREPMIANRDDGCSHRSWNPSDSLRPSRWAASQEEALDAALEHTRDWILSRQDEDGYWVAELEGDTILESEYILL